MQEIIIGAVITVLLSLFGLIYRSVKEHISRTEDKIDHHVRKCDEFPNILIMAKMDTFADKQDDYQEEYRNYFGALTAQIHTLQTVTNQHGLEIQRLLDRNYNGKGKVSTGTDGPHTG